MPDWFIDPVVEEIHATRAAMLEAAGGEIDVLMAAGGRTPATIEPSDHPRFPSESQRSWRMDRIRPPAFR